MLIPHHVLSRPKSTLADGILLVLAGVFSDALLDDIIGNESVMAGEDDDLFMRAATPAGLTRRRRGDRSAKPDADGRVVAKMATMVKATEVDIGVAPRQRWSQKSFIQLNPTDVTMQHAALLVLSAVIDRERINICIEFLRCK
eukprot:scaffold866_cov116-Skeletonema_dohrnii-CCMP3373.AAC.2